MKTSDFSDDGDEDNASTSGAGGAAAAAAASAAMSKARAYFQEILELILGPARIPARGGAALAASMRPCAQRFHRRASRVSYWHRASKEVGPRARHCE